MKLSESPAASNIGELDDDLLARRRRDRGLVGLLLNLPAYGLIAAVRLYQITLSPFIGRQCRYLPTCSHYFIGAVRKYGAVRGAIRGVGRIARCHPWHPGGLDPP